ncbi:PAS/PAC sensor hybrid histidine kinase [Nitrosospira multiformis ATCC 25196]|uniref:histidine kinase n=2 Tax=Nitrosospira multiformis TaxID=1231 RepID=Q2Y8X8_NITMU|nr:PAS/PAC sensor hybrid histidine kinase [Nitrosospira multiformis ATCC 25196]SEG19454.1 PAS/PAC sensor hybrid histidine kinase [Nitrosospira multiformis ATCC 25196]
MLGFEQGSPQCVISILCQKEEGMNERETTSCAELPGWLQGSEMGALIFTHDWIDSSLGPISAWSPALRFAVNMILLMPSAVLLLWGPKLIQIYNDGYRNLMGAKHPDGLGQPVSECWPEVWHFLAPICEGVMERRQSFSFDDQPLVINRTGSPEEAFFKLTYSPVPDIKDSFSREVSPDAKQTGVSGVLVTVTETTELVRARAHEAKKIRFKEALAEQALRESEQRFCQALEIETVGIIFFDSENRITEANDAFLEMSGFSRDDERAGALRCDELIPPEWRMSTSRAAEELKAMGRVAPHEKELFRKDGSRWWALIAMKQLLGNEAVAYVVDITERKRVEHSLRESEARFRALAEASPALIWQVDPQGNAVYLNQRYQYMFGKSLEELMPTGWRELLHPDDAPAYVAAFERALHDRAHLRQRVRARTAEGEWRWLKSYALPWFTVRDEYAGHVGISIDITEAVAAETALLEADRRKDEFLATLAHELRNPLAPIASALTLIAGPDGAAEIPRLLPVINRQVNYMVRLVDDLLEISRITSGKVELRQKPTDLAIVLRNAAEASMEQIREKELELSISITDTPLIVYGDTVRLEQIFANLLNNAVRYTGRGGKIWLTARQEDHKAVVSVKDNGIGILPGMLPRLFDMFAQERRSGMGTQEGLGIGLNLVDRLVQMHGGSVEASSEGKDKGSEFTVRLPLSEITTSGKSGQSEKVAFAPQELRVLVVDDNQDAAEVLCMLLQSMGVDVKAVDSGPAALATLPHYLPDVVLMDIGMPGMDGNEVARRIRVQPQFNNIKLIALTGWGQEKDRQLSHESGFDHHLTKPVNFKVLTELIASI